MSAFTGVALNGQQQEQVLDQPPFKVVSAFWPNLHHFLFAEAWARRSPTEESAAGPIPEPKTAPFTDEERRVWDAAVHSVLSLYVRVFTHPAANAALHVCAVLAAVFVGRLLASRMGRWSLGLRAPSVLATCALAYGIGRGLAGLIFSRSL